MFHTFYQQAFKIVVFIPKKSRRKSGKYIKKAGTIQHHSLTKPIIVACPFHS